MNETLQLLHEAGLPLTWENFLQVQFLGDPPKELDAESEEELAAEFDAAFLEDAGITGDAEGDE